MTSVGRVLHDGRFVFSVVEFRGGHVLFETKFTLSASFSYIGSLVFTGLIVGACARCKIDDAGFAVGF